MGSWLVAVDLYGRRPEAEATFWGQHWNDEKYGTINNVKCMLYLVYALLDVCCTRFM